MNSEISIIILSFDYLLEGLKNSLKAILFMVIIEKGHQSLTKEKNT